MYLINKPVKLVCVRIPYHADAMVDWYICTRPRIRVPVLS